MEFNQDHVQLGIQGSTEVSIFSLFSHFYIEGGGKSSGKNVQKFGDRPTKVLLLNNRNFCSKFEFFPTALLVSLIQGSE